MDFSVFNDKKDKIYVEIPKSANGYRMKSDYLNTQS